MILREGIGLIVTIDGLKQNSANRCDTETLLYFEQQLDLEDGSLKLLSEVEDDAAHWGQLDGYTHRFTSIHGGNFNVRAEEGDRAWEVPELKLPDGMHWLKTITTEAETMTSQIRRLMAANRILEDELRAHRLALLSSTALVGRLELDIMKMCEAMP